MRILNISVCRTEVVYDLYFSVKFTFLSVSYFSARFIDFGTSFSPDPI